MRKKLLITTAQTDQHLCLSLLLVSVSFQHRDQISSKTPIKSLHAHGDLLVTMVSNLDPDQARQNVGPHPIPSCLALSFCP